MEYAYPDGINPAIDWILQDLNLAIATLTNIGCIIIVVVTLYWFFKLKHTKTLFRPFIFAVAFAKAGVWLWTFTQILHVIVFKQTLPVITLAPRVMLMTAVFIQLVVIAKYIGKYESVTIQKLPHEH